VALKAPTVVEQARAALAVRYRAFFWTCRGVLALKGVLFLGVLRGRA